MSTLEQLREYVRREGAEVGEDACLWADTFAHQVHAESHAPN